MKNVKVWLFNAGETVYDEKTGFYVEQITYESAAELIGKLEKMVKGKIFYLDEAGAETLKYCAALYEDACRKGLFNIKPFEFYLKYNGFYDTVDDIKENLENTNRAIWHLCSSRYFAANVSSNTDSELLEIGERINEKMQEFTFFKKYLVIHF